MIHVSVGQQDGVDGGKIGNAKAGTSLPPEHDEPRGKDGIDEEGLAGGLNQKRRMANEGDGCLGRANLGRLGWSAGERPGVALAYQTPELAYFCHPERDSESHLHLEYRCRAAKKDAEPQLPAEFGV